MKRIILNQLSFIAFVDYHEGNKSLFVTFRGNGHQYEYKNVSKTTFKKIQEAKGKGSFISTHVLNNEKTPGEFVKIIPLATVEQITKPKTNSFRFLAR